MHHASDYESSDGQIRHALKVVVPALTPTQILELEIEAGLDEQVDQWGLLVEGVDEDWGWDYISPIPELMNALHAVELGA